MVAYGNLHLALEQLRVRAACKLHGSPTFENPNQDSSAEPPRVLVLGPEHSGKTTVSKLLLNYCTRVGQGWAPVLVNVDPSEVRHTLACPIARYVYNPDYRVVGQLQVQFLHVRWILLFLHSPQPIPLAPQLHRPPHPFLPMHSFPSYSGTVIPRPGQTLSFWIV